MVLAAVENPCTVDAFSLQPQTKLLLVPALSVQYGTELFDFGTRESRIGRNTCYRTQNALISSSSVSHLRHLTVVAHMH